MARRCEVQVSSVNQPSCRRERVTVAWWAQGKPDPLPAAGIREMCMLSDLGAADQTPTLEAMAPAVLQGVDALVASLPGLRTVEIGATLEGASVVPPELVGQAATAS